MDLCNKYLEDDYENRLDKTVRSIQKLRKDICDNGWELMESDPLKITIRAPKDMTGIALAEKMRQCKIECEYADNEYMVCMMSPENPEGDFQTLCHALGRNKAEYSEKVQIGVIKPHRIMSVREAIFGEHEVVAVINAVGRVCGSPTVSCPPAIPIVISGEIIDEEAVKILEHYNIKHIEVVKE